MSTCDFVFVCVSVLTHEYVCVIMYICACFLGVCLCLNLCCVFIHLYLGVYIFGIFGV